jgi:hypothetical protein
MPEVSTIFTIFDKFLNVIGLIREGKIRRDNKIDSALHALYTALSETKAYVVSLKNGADRNRNKEHNLAKLWHEASVPLRHIDPELAGICFLKGSYWLEPEAWTEAMVQENQIALDHVFNRTKELLIGK